MTALNYNRNGPVSGKRWLVGLISLAIATVASATYQFRGPLVDLVSDFYVSSDGAMIVPRSISIDPNATAAGMYAPLRIGDYGAEPSIAVEDDLYLDDGTNTASGMAGWRRYNGSAWVDVAAAGGASAGESYVVLALSGSLSAERVLAAGTGLDLTDGGANGNATFAFDSTEIGTTTWGSGSAITWTFNASGGTDPTLSFGDGLATFGHDLKITGDDLYMNTNTDAYLLIADGTNFNPVAQSGDVLYSNSGASAIQANAVALTTDTTGNYVASITNGAGITGGDGGSEGAALTLAATLGTAIDTTEITDATILAGDLNVDVAPADGDFLQYDATGTNFTWRDATETKTDLSLNNVENTALSTWAGTASITTLGTIATGTWNGTAIGNQYGGTAQDSSGWTGYAKIAAGVWSADAIDLGTDTTGNYAAGDAEAGAALTGDSATAFFSAGTIEHEYGGLEANVSGYSGLVAIAAGATAEVDALSELIAQLADVTAFITDDDMPAAGTDPDVDAAGEIGRDTDAANETGDSSLRGYDGANQFLYSRKLKTIQFTLIEPDGIDAADLIPIWLNTSGYTFTIVEWQAFSDDDNVSFELEELTDRTDFTARTQIDACEIATDGTGVYYGSDGTITHAAIEAEHLIAVDFDATDTPDYVQICITGWFDANVD